MEILLQIPEFKQAYRLQQQTVGSFYRIAREIGGSDCPVGDLPPEMLSFQRNFFSTFFLVVIRLLVQQDTYMGLYAMVNQAMRAWVTASDNILDDEYKPIFDFGIQGQGPRMRSILTIMLADRILHRYLLAEFDDSRLADQVFLTSLHALMPSALQESEEETGAHGILTPGQIVNEVHQRKTTDLFAATLCLPERLETPPANRRNRAQEAVAAFGRACQVLDDIKDMAADVQMQRHNLLVAIIHAETGHWVSPPETQWDAWAEYPDTVHQAQVMAQNYFADSFAALADLGIVLGAAQQAAVVGLIYHQLGVPPMVDEVSGP